ncbi:hypothetical protein [Geodermatophilus ruber]|uniref:LysM domain-containing protein n=1 Tax=Geodermatophilus ruber TaxID=504800 RepID=A0A1I4JIS9_9ACTN|nr:hypothetical protein [Geodermatophilus ruber]SFL66498.1 hypothetical protein SAMN04488085_11517 [Geodermatophilus ruber]
MSIRRLISTTAAMLGAAAALRTVTPDLSWLSDTGADLQRATDTVGAETLLLSGVAALAWAVWAWGLLGLLLTALSALPGAAGALARAVATRLLPAGARRAAALALGVGLVTGAPLLAGCGPAPAPAASVATGAASSAGAPVPDWPAAASTPARVLDGPVPDWPVTPPATATGTGTGTGTPDRTAPVPDWSRPAPGEHVVLRGQCLWDIAARDLRDRTGQEPTNGAVAEAVGAWWHANAAVIGPDPDVLLPGQVLRHPTAP